MSLPGEGGDFAKGASGPSSVYDTSPAGLGLSPSYLASSSASASASGGGFAQQLTGFISGAGAITAGTGFSVAKLGTGQYGITFSTAFTTTPIIFALVNDNTGPASVPQAANVTTTGCQINVVDNLTGAFADKAFYFLAIRPL